MTSPTVGSISPKGLTTQFVNMMADLLGEYSGLHGVNRDRSDQSFDEGGPASHRKILGLPSFNALADIVHQMLI